MPSIQINIPLTNEGNISRNDLYNSIAFLISLRSTCIRGKVGCLILRDKRIIATGYNGNINHSPCHEAGCNIESSCQNAMHAEANAIAFAAKAGVSLAGTTLWCTHSPCINCARLIIQAGIAEVVYEVPFRTQEGLDLLVKNHVIVKEYAQS